MDPESSDGVDFNSSELKSRLRSLIEIEKGKSNQFGDDLKRDEYGMRKKHDNENKKMKNHDEKKNNFINKLASKSQSDEDNTDVDSEADINDNISITSSLDGLSLSQISFHAPLTAKINHDYKEKEQTKKSLEIQRNKKRNKSNGQILRKSHVFCQTLSLSSSLKKKEDDNVPNKKKNSKMVLSNDLVRPKISSNLAVWHPRSYQSKQNLQRKYDEKDKLSLLALQTIERFNSNMIHSSVGEIMPVSNNIENVRRQSKKGKNIKHFYENGEKNVNKNQDEQDHDIIQNYDNSIKPFLRGQSQMKAINDKNNLKFLRMERMIRNVAINNNEHEKNNFIIFSGQRNDPLINKKSKLFNWDTATPSISKEGSLEISLQSNEILLKTSHLVDERLSTNH